MAVSIKTIVATVSAIGSVVATTLAQLQAANPTVLHVSAGVLAIVTAVAVLLRDVNTVVQETPSK